MIMKHLHSRIALPAAALIVLVLLFVLGFAASNSASVAQQLLLQQGFNFSRNISILLVDEGLERSDVRGLEGVIRSLRLDGARSIKVFDPQGKMLVDGIRGVNGGEVIRGGSAPAIPRGTIEPRIENPPDSGYFLALLRGHMRPPVIWHPVTAPSGRMIGWLRVELDTDSISQSLQSIRNSSLIILTLSLLCVSLGSYALIRHPLRALGQAAQFAQSLRPSGNGQLDGYSGVEEIDKLFTSLNRAASELNLQSSELNRRKRFMDTLADSVDGAIFATDGQGKTVFVNNGLVKLSGYSKDELLDAEIWSLLEGRDSTGYLVRQSPHRHVIETGHSWSSDDLMIKNAGGRAIPVELLAAPLNGHDGVEGAVMVLIDNSARNQATRLLQDAREQAEAANIAKGRFLHAIGHELRTPLNAIVGMTQLALSKGPDAQVRRCLQVIADSGSMLRGLIENVLEYASADGDENDQSSFFLTELLDRAIHEISERAQRKDITVSRSIADDMPRHLLGDISSISRILSIYCDNAVKYTETGIIEVRASGTRLDDRHVRLRIEVQDSGIGIEPDLRDRLFSDFDQVEVRMSGKRSGIGLGLALVKQLAERVNGSVGVESIYGEGSVFWFEGDFLVAASSATDPGAVSTAPGAALAGTPGAMETVAEEQDSQLVQVIQEISDMLANSEFTASRQLEVYRDLLEEISPHDLQRMRHALRVFDFDEAQEALEQLRSKARQAQKALYSRALGMALNPDAQGQQGSDGVQSSE